MIHSVHSSSFCSLHLSHSWDCQDLREAGQAGGPDEPPLFQILPLPGQLAAAAMGRSTKQEAEQGESLPSHSGATSLACKLPKLALPAHSPKSLLGKCHRTEGPTHSRHKAASAVTEESKQGRQGAGFRLRPQPPWVGSAR